MEQSLAYQQFSTNVDEEESWINEKNTVVASDDYGDTLAAAQVSVEPSQGRDDQELCARGALSYCRRLSIHIALYNYKNVING